MLYIYLNKGFAYSYTAELILFIGVILLFYFKKDIIFIWDVRFKMLLFFITISFIYIIIFSTKYSIIQVIRDSFIFQYSWFALIIFLFKSEKDIIYTKIFKIYKYFPVVAILNFILQYYVPVFTKIQLFGSIPILLYKNGDMAINLLASLLFLLYNQDSYKRKEILIYLFLILLNFLIISAYSRSGMLSFLIGFFLFYFFNKDLVIKKRLKSYFKYLPLILVILIPIFKKINVKENFQGRSVGFDQLNKNITSIFSESEDPNLDNNEIWRLIWWGKIIDYSFTPSYFFTGRGLGMSLVTTDDVKADDDLRSPHNFHLSIMARFGVIIFCLWIFWIITLFKNYFIFNNSVLNIILLSILFAFIFNSTFDVFLEGPMGAFPFWTFFGLYLLNDIKSFKTISQN